jgi:hypothetical protein
LRQRSIFASGQLQPTAVAAQEAVPNEPAVRRALRETYFPPQRYLSRNLPKEGEGAMNGIYLIGLIVLIMFSLPFLGLR